MKESPCYDGQWKVHPPHEYEVYPTGGTSNSGSNQDCQSAVSRYDRRDGARKMNDFDILKAYIVDQLEFGYQQRVDRAFWHGEEFMEVECVEPQCPCGTSITEGPARPSKLKGIFQ